MNSVRKFLLPILLSNVGPNINKTNILKKMWFRSACKNIDVMKTHGFVNANSGMKVKFNIRNSFLQNPVMN